MKIKEETWRVLARVKVSLVIRAHHKKGSLEDLMRLMRGLGQVLCVNREN